MKGSEIRTIFLDYFKEHGHTAVPSSALVPGDDPTLLFTNAGMVQFKSVFLGGESRPYSRATTAQKCVRAGGKHNDLENVGRTARHHTFFEMLGNFSFGDYFKEGAIEFAWDLLIKRLELDPSRLYVSVHENDDEAYAIWRDKMGVPAERILRLGDKDNFWSMGDTGPCGPCSEILYDQGEGTGCGQPDCKAGFCDCDRYLEIWNLVFMQYDRDSAGKLTPLPNPSIDTGMGLERITAVKQGCASNYDTDLFMPLIGFISELAGVKYGANADNDVSVRVIADHARATAFLVCDGVLPSNEGRGYVLRRIIRRAARHGKLLGFGEGFLYKVALKVVDEMASAYPELEQRRDFIEKVILAEEERFLKTLDKGLGLLAEVMDKLKLEGGKVIAGEAAFQLYDTFGFPLDLTEDIAAKEGFTVDKDGFEAQMQQQRELARASSNFDGEIAKADADFDDSLHVNFVGYDNLQAGGTVLALKTLDGQTVEILKEGEEGLAVLDRTPYYGESGGQIGDTGLMTGPNLRATVTDTRKTASGLIIHRVKITFGELKHGQTATMMVDSNRRKNIMRHHSATHLLQKGLQQVLGDHVHQSGSLVTDERARFDFTHFEALSAEQIKRIEAVVNQYVLADFPIKVDQMDKERAVSMGAMALFGEKYGDTVRVVSMGGVSVELCGGTHCAATGEIGLIKIIGESSVSAGVRRLEAVAGMEALKYVQSQETSLDEIAGQLKCAPGESAERIQTLQHKLKEQENRLKELKLKLATGGAGGQAEDEVINLGGHKVIIKQIEADDVSQLREVGDRLKERLGSGVVFLSSPAGGKATFMIMVTDDLTGQLSAGNLMQRICKETGGRGGGKPAFAQGGAPEAGVIENATAIFKQALEGK